jgi:hypothetical protein
VQAGEKAWEAVIFAMKRIFLEIGVDLRSQSNFQAAAFIAGESFEIEKATKVVLAFGTVEMWVS